VRRAAPFSGKKKRSMSPSLAERLISIWSDPAGAPDAADTLLRAALAGAIALVFGWVCGPRWIAWLAARFREPLKCPSAELTRLQSGKAGTPTMGGMLIVASVVVALLACGDWTNGFLPIAVFSALALAALGACDDLVKLATWRRGLSARAKLAGQCAIALVTAVLLYRCHAQSDAGLELALPWLGTYPLGWMYVPWAALVIVGFSNAVNLTDGLDGLAGGCVAVACGALVLVALASGNAEWAETLKISYVPSASEMAVVAAATLGGLLAFLWFNWHPARVFMGDTGSLPLGGVLAVVALAARQELLLVVIGGVFVIEAASVMLQVASFRATGKRIFRCAPLHHHFQFLGWPERLIVRRFWLAGGTCAAAGLAWLALGATLVRPMDGTNLSAKASDYPASNYPAKKCLLGPNSSCEESVLSPFLASPRWAERRKAGRS